MDKLAKRIKENGIIDTVRISGVNKVTLHKIVNTQLRQGPTLKLITGLALAFNVDYNELLGTVADNAGYFGIEPILINENGTTANEEIAPPDDSG